MDELIKEALLYGYDFEKIIAKYDGYADFKPRNLLEKYYASKDKQNFFEKIATDDIIDFIRIGEHPIPQLNKCTEQLIKEKFVKFFGSYYTPGKKEFYFVFRQLFWRKEQGQSKKLYFKEHLIDKATGELNSYTFRLDEEEALNYMKEHGVDELLQGADAFLHEEHFNHLD